MRNILIISIFLLTSCVTMGVRSLDTQGEKVCDQHFGLYYIEINKDLLTNARWQVEYHCIDDKTYGQSIY